MTTTVQCWYSVDYFRASNSSALQIFICICMIRNTSNYISPLYCFYVIIFPSTISVNKDKYNGAVITACFKRNGDVRRELFWSFGERRRRDVGASTSQHRRRPYIAKNDVIGDSAGCCCCAAAAGDCSQQRRHPPTDYHNAGGRQRRQQSGHHSGGR